MSTISAFARHGTAITSCGIRYEKLLFSVKHCLLILTTNFFGFCNTGGMMMETECSMLSILTTILKRHNFRV